MFFFQYLILSLFKLFAIYSSVLEQSKVVEYAIAPADTHPNQVYPKTQNALTTVLTYTCRNLKPMSQGRCIQNMREIHERQLR